MTQTFTNRLSDAELQAQLCNGINLAKIFCHGLSHEAGWWSTPNGELIDARDPTIALSKIALMHSELSEAVEGIRTDSMDDHLPSRKMVEVELAGSMIRILDLAGAMELDVAGAFVEKLLYNVTREDHKIENRAKEGGKKV